jgi:hypothetical protein
MGCKNISVHITTEEERRTYLSLIFEEYCGEAKSLRKMSSLTCLLGRACPKLSLISLMSVLYRRLAKALQGERRWVKEC